MAEPAPKRLRPLAKVDCKNLNVDDFVRIGFFDIEQRRWDGLSEGVTFQDRTHAHYFDDEPRSVCQQYLDWLFESAGIQNNFNLIDLQVNGDQLLLFRAPPDEKLPPDIWHKISQYNPREGRYAFGVMTQQTAAEATNPLRVRQVSRGIGGDYAPIDDVCKTVTIDMRFNGPSVERRMDGLTRECEELQKVVLVGAQVEIGVAWNQVTYSHPRLLSRFLGKVKRLVIDSRDYYVLNPHDTHMWVSVLAAHPNLTLEFNRAQRDLEFAYPANPHRDRVHIRVLNFTSPTIDNFSAHIDRVVSRH